MVRKKKNDLFSNFFGSFKVSDYDTLPVDNKSSFDFDQFIFQPAKKK